MLDLLQDIAADTESPSGEDNPLRQVIINTHSPSVVLQVPEEALIMAELVEAVRDSNDTRARPDRSRRLQFSCLKDTWRAAKVKTHLITGKGTLLAYLNPSASERYSQPAKRRVMDRDDLQLLLALPSGA
jgi:hypothetical protein